MRSESRVQASPFAPPLETNLVPSFVFLGSLTLPDGNIYACIWDKGKPASFISKFDSKSERWSMVEYIIGGQFHEMKVADAQENAMLIQNKIKQEINSPYYKSLLLENPVQLEEVSKYRIKLVKLDDRLFYHGIVRGSRPDG